MTARAPREQSVAVAVAVFALSGFVVLALLGFAAVRVLRAAGTDEAIRDAKQVTELAGRAVIAPAIDAGLVEGRADSRAKLRVAVQHYVLGGPVVRVKVWDAAGRIVWSDEPRLVGHTFPLDDEERGALRDGTVDASVSDLDEPENRYERSYGKLLEVYRGIRAADGQPLLFETYQRSSAIEASGRRLWQRFLPALIGALVALELAQIPLAYLLARRLRDRQRERSALLQHAVDASDAERLAMARALHDGPVQALAGVAFSLAATARTMDPATAGAARDTVEEAAARTRGTMRDLRAMLVDLYPATLHRSGLQAAITDLLAPLREEGLAVSTDIPADLALPAPLEALLFRGAREAIQNVRKHAGATSVALRIVRKAGSTVLTVTDDGRGLDAAAGPEDGHLGLRLLADLAAEGGGRLDLDTAPGQGTVVRLEVGT